MEAPDGARARIFVEAKTRLEPRQVPRIAQQLSRLRQQPFDGEQAGLVLTDHVSARTRELLTDARLGWFDLTGNVHLRLSRPAMLIDREGAIRTPYTRAEDRRQRSLRGGASARVVRALLDGTPPFGVRALAEHAKVGVATSARVLELLARDEVITRAPEGTVTRVGKRTLVRQWTQDYGLTKSNTVTAVLAPRGLDRTLRDLAAYDRRYALTAGAAARVHLPETTASVAPLSLLVTFVADLVAAEADLGLRPVERGANVLLVEPFDDVVYVNSSVHDGRRYVSASQTVADLLTAPGRGPEEARQMLDHLATLDEGWSR